MWRDFMLCVSLNLLNILLFITKKISEICIGVIKPVITNFLEECDLKVNGDRSFDPKVNDDRFYSEIFAYGVTGVGIAYECNYFKCEDLLTLCSKLCTVEVYNKHKWHPMVFLKSIILKYLYVQTEQNAYKSVAQSYDESSAEVEEYSVLSSGIWKDAKNVKEAHENKFKLIAEQLKLKSGMKILDVGCGEGTLCKYLAENHDVRVIGVNISKENLKKARKLCDGLNVRFEEKSCMKVTGTYDRITCIQVFLHLGYYNMRPFFERMHQTLTKDGLLLLECYLRFDHHLPANNSYIEYKKSFMCYIPTFIEFSKAIEGLFVVEMHKDISQDMKKTFEVEGNDLKIMSKKIIALHGIQCYRAFEAMFAIFTAKVANQCENVCIIVLSKIGVKK